MARGGARVGGGRHPKPLVEHVREGTHRKDRHGDAQGIRPADGKRPKMPQGLSASMKTAWNTLLDDLEASALLDSADAPLYEAFAVAHGRAREARRLITKHGMLLDGAKGGVVANPMLRVEREALTQLRYLAEQLAIGMRARASLGLAVARGARKGADEGAEPPPAATAGRIGVSPRLVGLQGGNGQS